MAFKDAPSSKVDFSDHTIRAKTGTININQTTTTAAGALPGKLRISETGEQFDEMTLAFLMKPQEQRAYHSGKAGGLNRKPENLLCASHDMIKPDAGVREPQSSMCDTCPKGDINWKTYRETNDNSDRPPCDAFSHAIFIDTIFKIPVQMYIRSKARAPFKVGVTEVLRLFQTLRGNGFEPNWYDVTFKLSTTLIKTRGLPSYLLTMSDFKVASPEQHDQFAAIFADYTLQHTQTQASTERAAEVIQIAETSQQIDEQLAQVGKYVDTEVTV